MNTPNNDKQTVNLFGGDSTGLPQNLFSLFANLRSKGPVIRVPFPIGGKNLEAWMVVRMEEVVQVLKDHAHFTVDPTSIDGTSPIRENLAGDSEPSSTSTFFTGKSMLFVDEPDHRRLRSLVSKSFTPRFIESLRPRVQQIADDLLDAVQDKGQMDLVKDYAYPLPINVISEMLGVPKVDSPKIQVWSEALSRGLGLGKPSPEVAESMRALGAYTAQLVAEKRQNPSDDLISQLILSEEDGDRLNEEELVSMITLLIFAGHETTSNLISIGSLMLLDHPEQLERLKTDFSLAPSAVEELLRFNGPSTIVGPRFATEDIELGGQLIKKGEMVIAVVKSANRDGRVFTDPDDLDLTRKITRHLAFGHGIHKCLGAPLARIEGDIAFTTLLKRLPNLRLSVPRENLTWSSGLTSQGITSLPVSF